jgi:N-acetylmuramic acid 6-phosphate etherase
MVDKMAQRTTEGRNQNTLDLDTLATIDILKSINQEDRSVAGCVARAIPNIALAVEVIVAALQNGGRLIYVGAGTSGRLGVLDAAEIPPTFGVDPGLIQAVIAGGREAIFQAVENCEDDQERGGADLEKRQVNSGDVVLGIAASGGTPYVIGALRTARQKDAKTIALVCNGESELSKEADLSITVVVGPEVLTGSTRMKAGTAQKLVLNMLSTAVMVRMGKVYQNFMVDMRPSNQKLVGRAVKIITAVTRADEVTARRILQESGYHVKTAIVMAEGAISKDEAVELLNTCQGRVREALCLLKADGRKPEVNHLANCQD